MSSHYDLVVIGSGPAGEKAAVQAAYFGKSVAVVEAAAEPGGACVHTGTLPSKTLREAALFLSGHESRHIYGLHVALDRHEATPRLLSRKEAVRRLEVERIQANLARHGVTTLHGRARFVDPHRVRVTAPDGQTQEVTARVFIIATGSSPARPADIPFDDPLIDDSDEILRIDRLPERLVVLGAGVIGCEYACMFAALGTHVTLVEGRDQVLPFVDREIAAELLDGMAALGITLHTRTRYRTVARSSDTTLTVALDDGSVHEAERVLYCTGRSGNTQDLGLEVLGLVPDKRGNLAVDASYRTPVPHVYAVGDVVGFPALASAAMEQGRVAAVHAFDLGYKTRLGHLLPYGLYTIPEVSFVGLTEAEATQNAEAEPFVVGRARLGDTTRGKIQGLRGGLLKLIVARRTRALLGVHVVGDSAAELVHLGQALMTTGGTVDTLIELVFNHPTLSEAYKYAAYDALGALALDARPADVRGP